MLNVKFYLHRNIEYVETFLFIILEASARLHHNKQYHPRHAIILYPAMGICIGTHERLILLSL